MEYNVYCDESCHLERDRQPLMVLGAVWCKKNYVSEANKQIRIIKESHGLKSHTELKWTKISPSKALLYRDLVDYFVGDKNLHFRAVVAINKGLLNHEIYDQNHDDWYYKIYFLMLRQIFDPEDTYNVYLDIKDTAGAKKAEKLWNVLCNSNYDFEREIIRKLQIVRSYEVELLQLSDVLIGAVMYANRRRHLPAFTEHPSEAKLSVVERLIRKTKYSLIRSTLPFERKMNIFVWSPKEVE